MSVSLVFIGISAIFVLICFLMLMVQEFITDEELADNTTISMLFDVFWWAALVFVLLALGAYVTEVQ